MGFDELFFQRRGAEVAEDEEKGKKSQITKYKFQTRAKNGMEPDYIKTFRVEVVMGF